MLDFYSELKYEKDSNILKESLNSYYNTELCNKTEFWLRTIFKFIFSFYNSISNKSNFSNFNEKQIKIKIVEFLNENEDFCLQNITINREPASKSKELEGYEDIKFESVLWKHNKEYLVLECKCLNDNKTSLKEYLFNENKNDGGLYRFLIGKYSPDVSFGGLLGFFQNGSCTDFIKEIKDTLISFIIKEKNIEFGNLINSDLLNKKVTNFNNSFQSDHKRFCNNKIDNIHMYHLFYDFSN